MPSKSLAKSNPLARRLHAASNETYTENQAKTYKSTLSKVLDFFYLAPSRQGLDNLDLFEAAFREDARLAIKAAFYIRDVRGGQKQKKTFQDILRWLHDNDPALFEAVVAYVPEFGYWKDILPYVDNPHVRDFVRRQYIADLNAAKPSLLGKWLPSENATAKETIDLARQWIAALNTTERQYRKALSSLRKRLDVLERRMSAREWEQIIYSHVPSRAMLLHGRKGKAFEKHDAERFHAFAARAEKGEEKIHSNAVYPHEIASKVLHEGRHDSALEAMWNQLPNFFGETERNVLTVVDTSGSMDGSTAGNSGYNALEVAVGLGLYCAERIHGPFQNMVITFSEHPVIEVIQGATLQKRLYSVSQINNRNAENTNLQAVFKLVLEKAKEAAAKPEDMPANVLIISDMEFDSCTEGTNLQGVQKQYADAGYDMPLLTFWNVNARHKQAPATKNEKGVFMVGGFSADIIGKVLQGKAQTPLEMMLEVLNSPRYSFVDGL